MNNVLLKLYSVRCLSNFCQAVFFPFFAVWLLREKLFSATEAAILVSTGIFATRLAGVFFSKWVQKYQKKKIILLMQGLLIVLYGSIYILAFYKKLFFPCWLLIALLIGSVLSINSLALLSCVALYQEEKQQHTGFSMINIALNISSGIGPYLGAFVLACQPAYFPLIPILFSLLASMVLIFSTDMPVEQIKIYSSSQNNNAWFGNRQFIFFIFLNMLTMLGYAQFYDVFPLYASNGFSEKTIGLLFIVSSIVIVLMQMPVTRLIEKWSISFVIFLSNSLLAVGTILLISARNSNCLLCVVGVILLSLAEISYAPLYQSHAVKLFSPMNPVRALAVQAFAWGIAEALAVLVGIYFVGHGLGVFSILFGVIAALCVAIYSLFDALKSNLASSAIQV